DLGAKRISKTEPKNSTRRLRNRGEGNDNLPDALRGSANGNAGSNRAYRWRRLSRSLKRGDRWKQNDEEARQTRAASSRRGSAGKIATEQSARNCERCRYRQSHD